MPRLLITSAVNLPVVSTIVEYLCYYVLLLDFADVAFFAVVVDL